MGNGLPTPMNTDAITTQTQNSNISSTMSMMSSQLSSLIIAYFMPCLTLTPTPTLGIIMVALPTASRTAARKTTTAVDTMATTPTQLSITHTPSFNTSSMTNMTLRPSITTITLCSMLYLTKMLTHMATTIPCIPWLTK